MPKTAERTTFTDLLREAVKTSRDLARLEDRAYYKLSAQAFVRDAIRNARTTPEKVAALRKTLDEDGGRTLREAVACLRRMQKFITEDTCTRAPASVHRLSFLDPRDLAAAEVVSIGETGLLELFAVAATIAAEQHPEAFGQNEDWPAWERRCAEVRERRIVLLQRIEREHGGDDLQITVHPPCSQCGRVLTGGFTIAGGEVPPGPGCGERLVAWVRANPEALRRLGLEV